jgi:hypothetical protein
MKFRKDPRVNVSFFRKIFFVVCVILGIYSILELQLFWIFVENGINVNIKRTPLENLSASALHKSFNYLYFLKILSTVLLIGI